MGGRANFYLKNEGIYFYAHWSGSEMGSILKSALVRARGKDTSKWANDSRWEDPPYLARIIFSELIKGDVLGTTGYGISNRLCDNEYPVIVIDTEEHTVCLAGDRHISGIEPGTPVRDKMSYADFIKLTDKEANTWHVGREEE